MEAFDGIHWPTLPVSLRERAVPTLVLDNVYDERLGKVMINGRTAEFLP